MDNNELINKITVQYPSLFSGEKRDLLQESLIKMSPVIKYCLEQYLTDGTVLELNLLGHSLNSLVNEHQMNPVAAFLTLDWIVREPLAATRSVNSGHDRVVLG